MKRLAIGAAAAGLLALAAVVPVRAAMTVSPFAGAWHWNKDESKLIAGIAAPTEIIWDIKNFTGHGHNDYNRVQMSLEITYPDGSQRSEGFDGAFDGKPYPIRGRDDGATRSYTVLPDGSLESQFTSKKSPTGSTSTCKLSDDHKKMTCTGTAPDAQGKAQQFVAVFDRIVSTGAPKKK